jgi:hypothetical protein
MVKVGSKLWVPIYMWSDTGPDAWILAIESTSASQATDAGWRIDPVCRIPHAGCVLIPQGDSEALALMQTGLMRVRGKTATWIHQALWLEMFPSTVVMDDQGSFYIGANDTVIRLQPTASGAYDESWLETR